MQIKRNWIMWRISFFSPLSLPLIWLRPLKDALFFPMWATLFGILPFSVFRISSVWRIFSIEHCPLVDVGETGGRRRPNKNHRSWSWSLRPVHSQQRFRSAPEWSSDCRCFSPSVYIVASNLAWCGCFAFLTFTDDTFIIS